MNPRPTDYESVALPLSYPGAGDSPYHRPLRLTSPDRPAVAWLLPAALVACAAVALGARAWGLSGAAALVVAALPWRRHPRARFAAYVYGSALALRGLVRQQWVALAFAAGAIALLQLAAARRAWPRLSPRRGPRGWC